MNSPGVEGTIWGKCCFSGGSWMICRCPRIAWCCGKCWAVLIIFGMAACWKGCSSFGVTLWIFVLELLVPILNVVKLSYTDKNLSMLHYKIPSNLTRIKLSSQTQSHHEGQHFTTEPKILTFDFHWLFCVFFGSSRDLICRYRPLMSKYLLSYAPALTFVKIL